MTAAKYEAFGKSKTLLGWEKETGIPAKTLYWRICTRGWTPEEAIKRGPAQHGALPKYFTTYKGERMTVNHLAKITGIHYRVLRYRIYKMGMTGDEAVENVRKRGGARPGAGRKKLYANGCKYHPDCDSCPFDDCRM